MPNDRATLAPAGRPKDGSLLVGVPGQMTVAVSFDANEICAPRIYFKHRVRITKLSGIVTKAIAGTDDATVQMANSTGSMGATGLLTFTASDALNQVRTASPTGSNRVIPAGSYLLLTCAKATAGGKAQLTVEYESVSKQV